MIANRTFPDYDTYVHKQGGKARGNADRLMSHLDKNTRSFETYFRRAAEHLKAGSILCLGARTGAESLGAVDAGFRGSVGIDLHPVGPTVMQGDWHALPFPDAAFDNAYTNSLDHCLFLDRFCGEVKRVLAPGGRFYLMATNRDLTVEQWQAKGGNEGLYWSTSDELSEAICGFGFQVFKAWRDGKWGHYVFGVRP